MVHGRLILITALAVSVALASCTTNASPAAPVEGSADEVVQPPAASTSSVVSTPVPATQPSDPPVTDVAETAPPHTEAPAPILLSTPLDIGPLEPRGGHSVVWTGSEMVVWGGQRSETDPRRLNDGAAFDPATDEWRLLEESPLAPRHYHIAAWTGQEMLVIGGIGATDRAAYRPDTDSWRVISPPPISVTGQGGTDIEGVISWVWTGSDLVVWHVPTDALAAYGPDADEWRLLPNTGLGADNGVLRWTGEDVYAFGATVRDYPESNELMGARLDGEVWDRLPDTDFSTDEYVIGALPKLTAWVGDRFIAWSDSGDEGRTLQFRPDVGMWDDAPATTTSGCEGHGEPVTAGDVVFAFGWCGSDVSIFDGASDTWVDAAVGGYPTARSTVWTGTELVSWGSTCCYGTGGRPFTVEAWRFAPGG